VTSFSCSSRRPRKSRDPHRTDRHTHHFRRRLVREILDVHEDHRRAERLRELVERIAKRGREVQPRVDVVITSLTGCSVHRAGGDCVLLAVLEVDRRPLPLARAQEDVATDREEPTTAVRAGDESMPRPIGAQKGLLHHVVGIRLLARERQREAIDVVEPRERVALEGGISCDIAGGTGSLEPGVSRHVRLLDRKVG
jgi:hypothetical protein